MMKQIAQTQISKFMKQFKHFLLTVAAILCSISVSAYDFVVNGIYYNITSEAYKTVAVTYRGDSYDSYSNEYSGSITIPERVTYNGTTFSVTSIRSFAFRDCHGLTSVVIPNSVTSIGDYAFYSCWDLTSVEIPNSVTSIGKSAFMNCSDLTSVHITDLSAWLRIDFDNTYSNPLSYAKHLYLDGKEINDLVIPDDITNIKEFVFNGYKGLKSVSIHNNVNRIWHNTFSNCPKLTSIKIDEKNQIFDSRGGCNAIIETSTNKLISGCISTIIPNSVTSIGDYAFYECSGLTSITIGNSVTSIGDYAFYECSGLTSVTIPNSVTSIGYYAFYECSGLTSVTIGNSVTSIGDYAFLECSGLTEVHIADLTAWFKIKFASSYSNPLCYANHLFLNGQEVKELVIPEDVTTINNSTFYGYSGLTSVTIGNSVTSIGECAFLRCSGLTSVTIPNSVTSIGDYAFYECSGLTSITIGDGIERINYDTFSGCENLTSLTIGRNVENFDYNFNDSPLLTNVYCYAKTTPLINDSHVFENSTLHIPASSIREYMSTEPWSNFGTIVSLTDEEESEADPNDMTSLIVNARFDDDLAFSTDGKYKEGTALNAENNSLSDRSWSYVHPDGSCYAHAKTAEEGNENWKQKDSRTWASNGFVAQINGWECRKTEYPKCEWVYSGALPYGLHPRAIPIADDGATYQDSPSKPAFAANNDNKGALFLRVGWSGSLSYKQTLNIPGGKYRFEYWTINVNTSSSKSYTDLSNITFNDVALTDMSGNDLSSTKWTRHYIDFQLSSASTECVIEIACKAEHTGSGNLPHVFIDGLKLYKLGNIELEGLKYKLNDNNKTATVIGGDDSPKVVIPESFFYAGNYYNVTEIGDSAFKNSCIVSVNIPNSITKIGDSAFFGCHKLADIYCNSETVPTTAINAFDYTDAENITLHVPEKSITDYMNTEPWSMFCSITDILKEIAIIDNGEAYYNSYHKETNILTYTRTFNNTEWQALYIPFAINYDDWTEDFEVAKINDIHQFDVNEDGDFDDAEDKTIMEMLKVNSGTLKANHPYMIRAKSIGEKTLTVENGTLMPTLENSIDCSSVERKYVFTGTYSGINGEMMVSNKYYAMSGGNMKYSTNTANALKPFRWYMQIQDRDGQVIEEASEIKVVVRGDEDWDITGIEETNTDNGSFLVYSISGTLVRNVKATDINQATEGLAAGLYIVNGKKVFVK